MRVVETNVKEFIPYKVSIKINGDEYVLEYWVRRSFVPFDGTEDYVAHTEKFKTLEEAVSRFNEVVKEIKK